MWKAGILAATAFAVALLVYPLDVSAAFRGRGYSPIQEQFGGFNGPGLIPVSVNQARLTRADKLVIVRGNIKQQVGQEQYVFEDGTSSILVVIPDDRWLGQDITPVDLVELHGEVRKTPGSVNIRVAKLVKVR